MPLIGLISMLGPFSIDTYLPSFPAMAEALDADLAAIAQTLGSYLIAFAGATLIWGPVSDSFGRRRVLLLSLLLYVIASIGCAQAGDLSALILWRTLQGIAACGGMVIGRAVVRDLYHGPQAQRTMAHVMLIFAIAPAIAPLIGGWLHQAFGWRTVFHFLALFGLFAAGAAAWLLPETHPRHARQSIHPANVLRAYAAALRHPRFLALVATLSLAFGGLFLYITGSPALIYDHLGLDEGDFGIFFIPAVAGMMAGSWLAGRVAHHWEQRHTLNVAFAILLVATTFNLASSLWLPPTPFGMVAPLVLYALGSALMMPNLSVLALDCFPHHRGMASAAQGFAQMGFNALVASLLMPLVAASLVQLAVVQGVLLAAALLIWAWAAGRLPRPDAA